jgi:hypothetical protein
MSGQNIWVEVIDLDLEVVRVESPGVIYEKSGVYHTAANTFEGNPITVQT